MLAFTFHKTLFIVKKFLKSYTLKMEEKSGKMTACKNSF
ncbi:hypothetical protein HMPREF1128_2045 [Haemophilus sputorum HK 2154]|nr:hypothetical protein HMPREF1128_2045 [Haemophilus sputorum HK 2154]